MRQISQGREIPEFLSDHPSDERRIHDIERWVPRAEAAKRAFDKGNVARDNDQGWRNLGLAQHLTPRQSMAVDFPVP
jgi:hypothetical protein